MPLLPPLSALLLATAAAFNLPQGAATALRQQLQQMNEAGLRNDDAAVARSMYPRVVRALGGLEKARQQIQSVRLGLQADGATIVSATIGLIRGCAKVQQQIQCVVEGTQVIKIAGGRLRSESETVAFSGDGGVHWTFLSGGQDPAVLRAMLPELSPALPLRRQAQPTFEPD